MKEKFSEKIIIFTWIIFLFICLGLLSFTSHAEEAAYFPMSQNQNEHFTENDKTQLDTLLDNENYFIFIRWDGYSGTNNRYKNAVFVKYSKSATAGLFGEINNNGYQFSLYKSATLTCIVGAVQCDTRTGAWSIYRTYGDVLSTYFSNLQSSLYTTDTDYISNFRVYKTNLENSEVVLKYGPDPTPGDLGLPVPPDFTGLDPGWVGAGAADVVTPPASVPPSITINNYTWTTNNPPSFDSSSIEAAIESVGDIITYQANWLSNNLSGEFSNLGTNLKNLVDYIGKTIQYFGNLIIKNIQNGIQNLYDNMEALVKPILDKIDYISEPVSGTVIYDNISGTSLVSNINTINSALTSFQTSFNNVSEPSTYKIPIHLENLPIDYFGIQQVQYIDLGWLGSTEKGLIRTFMWALITYSLFITIVDSISNYINAGGDES